MDNSEVNRANPALARWSLSVYSGVNQVKSI
jgi:hypothetical protein